MEYLLIKDLYSEEPMAKEDLEELQDINDELDSWNEQLRAVKDLLDQIREEYIERTKVEIEWMEKCKENIKKYKQQREDIINKYRKNKVQTSIHNRRKTR